MLAIPARTTTDTAGIVSTVVAHGTLARLPLRDGVRPGGAGEGVEGIALRD